MTREEILKRERDQLPQVSLFLASAIKAAHL